MHPLSAPSSRAAILAAALLWSTGGAAIKSAALGAPAIAGGRALFAAIALFALLPAARARPTPPILKTAIAYALTCSLFVFANTLTTAGSAIFIQNTAPIWVLLAAPRIYGERPSRPELYSLPFALLGCALFFAGDLGQGRVAGDLCALGASLTYATLIMRYRHTTTEESLSATVLGNLIIVGVMLPLALDGPVPAARDLGILLYLGVVQQAVAAVLFVRGVRGVSALEGSLLVLLEPLASPVWAFILVGERLGPLAILGAAVVLAATAWRTWAARASEASTAAAPQ